MRLALLLALSSACAPTVGDDDAADDDDSQAPPSLDCPEPAEPPPDVLDCGLHEGLAEAWNWASFRSADRSVEVLIVRRWEEQGAGHSAIYSLQGFAARVNGCLVCVDDPALLSYDSTHHNWVDVAWAELAGETLRLETRFQPLDDDPLGTWDWRFPLSAHDPTDHDVVRWGPIELEAWGGLQPPA